MTPAQFRSLALKMPGAIESSHGGHPDFRAGKKVFATLGYPDKNWAMVKLTPEQQATVISAQPDIFSPAKGMWGKRGSTLLLLERTNLKTASRVIAMAWNNVSQ
ncbi:MAG: MmcQ/YjbR family DNA-binding protein [Tepidisphaeraceae bacterium]|jgi:hypothetical protein